VACTVLDSKPIAVTAGRDGTVRIWDLTTGTSIGEPLTGHTDIVEAVACTVLDSKPIAVTAGRDGTVRIWDLSGRREIDRVELPGAGQAVAVGAGGVIVAGFGWDVLVLERAGNDLR